MKNLLNGRCADFHAWWILWRAAGAQDLDMVGVNLLRAVTTNVDGAGIRVAQVEAGSGTGPIGKSIPARSASRRQPVHLHF